MDASSGHSYRPDTRRVPVGVTVELRREDEILMILRKGSHGEGLWSFPGGWMVPNEMPFAAGAREVWEEVGVRLVGRPEFMGYTVEAHPEDIHGMTMWFRATEWEGEPRNTNPDRIERVEWWTTALLKGALRETLFLPLRNALDSDIVAL